MRVLLITSRKDIESMAVAALRGKVQLDIVADWKVALDQSLGADLMIADLVSLLDEPNKISGYEQFALAKMSHESAKAVKLVLIPAPVDYELDSMMGWPDFLFAQFHNPITEQTFKMAMRWVDWD